MRKALFVASMALILVVVPTTAQADTQPQFDLEFTLNTEEGTIDIELEVIEPGNLARLHLAFGDLDRLQGEPNLQGAWTWNDAGWAIADLEETPGARASWTADGQIRTETLEGEGHTSYVGDAFAILRAGQMVPAIRYNYYGAAPSFQTTFTTHAPDGWAIEGPWERLGDRTFETHSPIPRGFLVADDDLDQVTIGEGEDAYRVARIEHTHEAEHTERILLTARDFLGGIYGEVAHQQFIVVGPDPMFRGGLASPDGVFLHADADESIVAHEMAHAYQSWQFSRGPDATIWLAEGAAEVHGKLLEVASEHETRENALEWLKNTHDRASKEHGVDLRTAVYGSGNERAAYTKGAVVVTAINDEIRDVTGQQYTFSDVLRTINEKTAEQGRQAWGEDQFTNDDLETVTRDVTGVSLSAFFDRYVYGADVPARGALFPGEAAVRLVDTTPSPVVAEEPFAVNVALTNLDTETVTVELPVMVDGRQNGTLKATVPAGASAQASADVDPQPRGTYELRIQESTMQISSLDPPEPRVTLDVWPPRPHAEENVTIGARIQNTGEAPYRGPVQVHVDGTPRFEQDEAVEGGQWRTFSETFSPFDEGTHHIQARAPNQTVLAETTFNVSAPDNDDTEPAPRQEDQQGSPGVPLVGVALVSLAAAALRRGPTR